MTKLFGTDGIRGAANSGPLTPDNALKTAQAVARYFHRGDHRHTAVIGKDTRLSGYLLEPALTSGFVSMGMDVVLVGPMPTPAVAMLTRSLRADLGVMISASHNPYQDNGLKFFAPNGMKLSDEIEKEIEDLIASDLSQYLATSDHLGRVRRLEDAPGRYIEVAKATFPRRKRLDGLKIVVDCAHGAAYKVAPSVLWELGAEVIALGVEPNGTNINDKVGATATDAMQQAVIDHQADLGIALDGDADRLIIADEKGQRIDGDQLMGVIAASWHRQGKLSKPGIVATVMSNLGLEEYLKSENITLHRTKVGDRYVLEKMRQDGYNLGGEQSGHIILSDFTTTGDGLIAALQFLSVLAEEEKSVSEICGVIQPYPQLLKNVRYQAGTDPMQNVAVQAAIEECEAALVGHGRLLIRKSGTEPVIRVMAEGQNQGEIERLVQHIVDIMQENG